MSLFEFQGENPPAGLKELKPLIEAMSADLKGHMESLFMKQGMLLEIASRRALTFLRREGILDVGDEEYETLIQRFLDEQRR